MADQTQDEAAAQYGENFPDPMVIKPPDSGDDDAAIDRTPKIFKAHPDPFARQPATPNPAIRPTPIAPAAPAVPSDDAVNSNWDHFLEGLSYLETNNRNLPPGSNPASSAAGYLQDIRGTRAYIMRQGLGDPWAGDWVNQRDVNRRYIERDFPQAAAAVSRGDFPTAIRMLRGQWPSLPGGSQQQAARRYPEFWDILGGRPPQRFMGNPGRIYGYGPQDWGRPDSILSTALSTPGLGPPGYMPQGSEISSLINSSVMGLANGGSAQSAQMAIAMLRFRANYLLALRQGQEHQAELLRQQQDRAYTLMLRQQSNEAKAVAECYAANETDVGGFSECIYSLPHDVYDPHNDKQMQSALKAPTGEVMDRVAKLMAQRHDDWLTASKTKAQSDKATKKENEETADLKRWGVKTDADGNPIAEPPPEPAPKPPAPAPSSTPASPTSAPFQPQGTGGTQAGVTPVSAPLAGQQTAQATTSDVVPLATTAAGVKARSALPPAELDQPSTPATSLSDQGITLPDGPWPVASGPYGQHIEFGARDMVATGEMPEHVDPKSEVGKILSNRAEINSEDLAAIAGMPHRTKAEKQAMLHAIYEKNPEFATKLYRWVSGLDPPPSSRISSKPPYPLILLLGSKLDETFNAATFKTRAAAWANLVHGKQGVKLSSGLLAQRHLDQLNRVLSVVPPWLTHSSTMTEAGQWIANTFGVGSRMYGDWTTLGTVAGTEIATALRESGAATEPDLYGPTGWVHRLTNQDQAIANVQQVAKGAYGALHDRIVRNIENAAADTGWSPQRIVSDFIKYGPNTSDSGMAGSTTPDDKRELMAEILGPTHSDWLPPAAGNLRYTPQPGDQFLHDPVTGQDWIKHANGKWTKQ